MLVLARLLLAAAGPAGPPLDLTWQAPPGCPDQATVTDTVSVLLRRPLTDVEPERAVARAAVVRAGARWQLRLELQTARGSYRRSLQAESCQVLARATALMIAIHLDPLAVTRGLAAPVVPAPPEPPTLPPEPPTDLSEQTAPAPLDPPAIGLSPGTAAPALVQPLPPSPPATGLSPGTAPPPLVQPLPPSPPPGPPRPASVNMAEETAEFETLRPPEPPPAPAPEVVAHVRLDGGLDYGVLPGLGGHGGLFAGVTLPRVRLEAGLLGVPMRVAPAGDGLAGGRFDRLVGAVRICPLLRPRPTVALGLCVGGEAGALRGVGLAVNVPNPRWAPWVGLFLGPAVRWQVAGPVGLWFGVDGVLALSRPLFVVGADQFVFQGGRAGVRATFGLDLQFGPRNR